MKKISIIVPAYNSSNYIRNCLNSIMAQTYSELEIIVIDDGSTDDTASIVREYVNKDNRIRLITGANEGVASARNAGLKEATGDYIGFVDSDDSIDKDMYKTMLSACIDYDADMAITAYLEIGNNAEKISYSEQTIVLSKEEALDRYVCENDEYKIQHCVWSRLFKKSIIDNLTFPTGHIAEEIMFVTKAMCNMNCCVYIDKPLYLYTVNREGSCMNVNRADTIFNDELPFLRERMGFFNDNDMVDLYAKASYRYYRRVLMYYSDFSHLKKKSEGRRLRSIIMEDKEQVLKIYDSYFVPNGDRARMKLFIKSPGLYRIVTSIYNGLIIPIRNIGR